MAADNLRENDSKKDDLNVVVAELTLALAALTSWEGKVGKTAGRLTRKSYDRKALSLLEQRGLVKIGKQGEPLLLTEAGMRRGLALAIEFDEHMQDLTELAMRTILPPQPVTGRRAFILRVTLDLGGRDCWRQIVVPASFTFAQLHLVIQAAFCWHDYHLYDFSLTSNGQKLCITNNTEAIDSMFYYGRPGQREVDPVEMSLDEVFPRTRSAVYTYDYGDDWRHRIKLEKTVPRYAGPMPAVLDGDGDAPPEDVGGSRGFEEFLAALADKTDPDHEHLTGWGYMQMFEPYSLEQANRRLADWASGKEADEYERRLRDADR